MLHSERRRTPRVPCDIACQWRRRLRTYDVRMRDLNVHGMLIVTSQTVELGFMMDLLVQLPSGPLEVLGVARYVGPTRYGHGIGVQMWAPTAEDTERWLAFYRIAHADLMQRLPAGVAKHL